MYQLEISLSLREDLVIRKHGLWHGKFQIADRVLVAGRRTVSLNSSSWVTTILALAGSQIMYGRWSTSTRLYWAWFSFFEMVWATVTPAPPPPRTTTFLVGAGADMEGGGDDAGV